MFFGDFVYFVKLFIIIFYGNCFVVVCVFLVCICCYKIIMVNFIVWSGNNVGNYVFKGKLIII